MRYQDPFNSSFYSIIPQSKLKVEIKKAFLFELLENFSRYKKEEENELIYKTIEEIKKLVVNRENKTDNKHLDKKVEVKTYIEKVKRIISLDEMHSTNKITPYHLSLLLNYSEEIKKAKGEFNTPYYIGKFLHEHTFSFYLKEQKKSLIELSKFNWADLSCGTGNLIMTNFYEAKRKAEKSEIDQEAFFYHLFKNLYATEIDPLSLAICKLRILLFFNYFFPEIPIQSKDITLEKKNILVKEQEEPFLDYILLNPPFMTYGLRNGQEYNEELKQYLRSHYFAAEYKLPLYSLFIERSIDLLKEGGLLGIISPDSFLLGRYYSKIRKFILKNSQIKQINLLDYEAFDKVTLGRTAISFFEKKKNKKDNKKQEFYAYFIPSYNHFINKDMKLGYKNSLPRKWLGKNEFCRFYLFFDEKEEKIVKNWFEKAEQKLAELVTIHTGVRSKIGQRKIISTEKLGPNWKKGLAKGKQVLPYGCIYNGHWLNIDRSLLWSGGFNPEIVEKTKILLRQTGDRLMACVDTNNYYHLNNIHSLVPKKKNVDLYSLAVILNSEEFNQVYQILS
ncbi:MAG: Eco57I restriction-modification methylase domain-containing protein, partial [Candidatus Heimdallarchaeaceae archaeon]